MARWGLGCLGVLVLLIAGGYGAFKLYEHNFRVAHAPAELEVTGINYAEEEAWGFGPGGNETGVIVYGLSESIAQKIATRGSPSFTSRVASLGEVDINAHTIDGSKHPLFRTNGGIEKEVNRQNLPSI